MTERVFCVNVLSVEPSAQLICIIAYAISLLLSFIYCIHLRGPTFELLNVELNAASENCKCSFIIVDVYMM
jgi:hypothetical protein